MKTRLKIVIGAVLSLTLGSRALALGTASYSSELISPRSLGQGGTGVAGTQNDPVAGYTNPAALTDLKGTQAMVGLSYVNGSPAFTNDQNQVSGARATSVAVPGFAASMQFLGGKLAAGLAAVTPYGLETHFNGDSPVRYSATDARLRVVDVTPSVAYRVCTGFSIGFGLDYFNALEGQLAKKIDTARLNGDLVFKQTGNQPLAQSLATGPDASSVLNGTGDGWGYHVGTTMRFNENHHVGLVYHSSAKVGLTGTVQMNGFTGTAKTSVFGQDFTANVTAPLYMPQNLQLGYAYTNDKWNVEADVAWYDWYAARRLGIVYSGLTAAQSAVLNSPSQNPLIFNPRKTLNFALGANYKYSDALQLRGGAYYQAAALPESYFDPAFVDLPRYALTLGAGYAVTKDLGLDVAYNAVFFHSRHVNVSSIDAAGIVGNSGTTDDGYSGNFSNFANIVAASLTYRTDWRF